MPQHGGGDIPEPPPPTLPARGQGGGGSSRPRRSTASRRSVRIISARGHPCSSARRSISSSSSGGILVLIGTPVDGLPRPAISQYRIVPVGVTRRSTLVGARCHRLTVWCNRYERGAGGSAGCWHQPSRVSRQAEVKRRMAPFTYPQEPDDGDDLWAELDQLDAALEALLRKSDRLDGSRPDRPSGPAPVDRRHVAGGLPSSRVPAKLSSWPEAGGDAPPSPRRRPRSCP